MRGIFGYRLDEELHDSSVARQNRWFEIEEQREPSISGYLIDLYPVTNEAYQAFVMTLEPIPRSWMRKRGVATGSSTPTEGSDDSSGETDTIPKAGGNTLSFWSPIVMPMRSATGGAGWKGGSYGFPPRRGERRRRGAPTGGSSPGATPSPLRNSTATTTASLTPCRSETTRKVRVPTASTTWRGRSLNGPPHQHIKGRLKGGSSSRGDHGMTCRGSPALPHATGGPTISDTSS